MIPQKIQSLFEFIDYLDSNKKTYIETYLPLCNHLIQLGEIRDRLNPQKNYRDKQQYDIVQQQIVEQFQPISENIYLPVTSKLKELGIWAGDEVFTSIWNGNISAIYELKENFTTDDIGIVNTYKEKYLSFRKETNSNFLCLQFVFTNIDEVLKALFDFFKDTDEDEFESFEQKTIAVKSMGDVARAIADGKGNNVRFSFPQESLLDFYNVRHVMQPSYQIQNEIIMGDKIQTGDIRNNSGPVIIGKDIRIADSFNEKSETAEKIAELINLIRKEQNITDSQKQSLITNFDKVREEIVEAKPDRSKIFKWLSSIKGALEYLVLSHDVTESVNWVFKLFNF